MRNRKTATYCVLYTFFLLPLFGHTASKPSTNISLQEDGSLVVYDATGGIAEFVKQGTPRQSIQLDGQNCNVSYGFNSAGKKTILVSLPPAASSPSIFNLGDSQVTMPPKSSLRITLSDSNRLEKLEGTPAGSVTFAKISQSTPASLPAEKSPSPESTAPSSSSPAPVTLSNPTPPAQDSIAPKTSAESPVAPLSSTPASPLVSAPGDEPLFPGGWPGNLLEHPLSTTAQEEDPFYVRTEGGARFVSSMNIVNIVGPNGPTNPAIEKEIAFSTGYRQDIDIGVWLLPWFGISIETGFALNAIRGNTQNMTVSSSTYWSVPILAQLCFQYPNESGFIPYANFGFGGGWNYFKIGSITYPGNFTTLSGSGNDMNNAYQIAAGCRYRLYEQFSLTLAYKFYGTSQPTVDMGDNQQVTFGSPVTNSIELGGNFSF
jgi:opacity protein-like surface antigen